MIVMKWCGSNVGSGFWGEIDESEKAKREKGKRIENENPETRCMGVRAWEALHSFALIEHLRMQFT
ncbi:hypothetical protein Sjap_003921 [Stephania japonica]|uniref:Uncharacterized protein n=1 Tax=Stephania japonica TaxID=461633 RepID=A0AAP0KPQ6_9MAGN